MKSLSIMMVVMILAGCSSMGSSSGTSYSSDTRNQMPVNRPDAPAYLGPGNIYFGGPS